MLTLLPRVPAAAADDCLTEPTGDKADGQHWRYRLESGRRCWYLKGSSAAAKDSSRNSAEDAAPRRPNQTSSAWDFVQPALPKLTPRRGTGPAPRVSTEALAADEASAATKPQPSAAPSLVRPQPANSFDDGQQRNAAAGPSWQPLDSADMSSPAPAASAPPPPDESAATSDPAASALPTDTPVAAPVKPVAPVAPIRKLLMVVVGALSLSGLLASALYRLSKVGRRRRRNRNWQRAITRARRNRDKPRTKSKVVHAGSRSGRAGKQPKTATTPATKHASPPLMPTPVAAVESKPTVAATPAAADPAAELVDLLASQIAKVAPPQAAATPSRPAEPLPDVTAPARAKTVDPAAELVDLLGSHAAKRAAQPIVDVAPAPAPSRPEATPPRLPLVADPAAELANLLESRFAPPPPSAKPVTTPARPQPPAVPVNTAAPKVVDPIAELANLLEAKASERAARFGTAEPFRRSSPPPAMPPAAKPVDPAAELLDMLEARAARTTLPQASAPRPVKAVQPPEPIKPVPANAVEAIKPAQPDKVMPPRRKKVAPSVRNDSAPASRLQAAAAEPDHRKVDNSKAGSPKPGAPRIATPAMSTVKMATPKAGKSARRTTDEAAPRRRGTELPPLPPALMLEPENDGPTPPLDFIPRPQALRPRIRDVRQDESLDGVQDILARLGKHS